MSERRFLVRRRRWARGAYAALILGTTTLLLSGCSVNGAEKDLRFGWPTGVTREATRMRVLWSWSGVAALALGVVVWGLIFWCCIRYRKRSDELPRQVKYNFAVEMVCVIVPFLVIIGLFWRTVVVEDDVDHLSKNPDVLIQVDAFKWNWQFEYHSHKADGTTGAEVTTAYSKDGKQLADPTDSSLPYYLSTVGSDEEIPVLVIPRGETVQIIEHSEDVIHSFWVPEFLFKRDVIPYGPDHTNEDNRFEFTATHEGSYVGRCAELCGTYHSQMNFEVRVVAPDVYTKYLAALEKAGPANPARQSQALVAAGMTPRATTTYPFNTDRSDRSASQNAGG